MKKLILGCSLFSLLTLNACKTSDQDVPSPNMVKAESILDFDCLRNSANVSLKIADVKKEIYGEWQLKGMITMVPPSDEVPNVKLIISEKADGKQLAEIYENDKLTKIMTYDLIQSEYEQIFMVGINPDKEKFDDGSYNFIRGSIRICTGELMIDNGMAFDAPAYLFRKNK
ncbi:hypothetical protein [Emticicia sp. BO119]|uniref:hypothetical protein n=1 Tax=Emticicia sp. BO119 TaxID=2757768 RepID=UPI0015F07AFC|nr:hypothetical protein [Emticicia sp. BO119]MBA4848933.1 hypothetical protein [Emticicia sp. BO119]